MLGGRVGEFEHRDVELCLAWLMSRYTDENPPLGSTTSESGPPAASCSGLACRWRCASGDGEPCGDDAPWNDAFRVPSYGFGRAV